MREEDKPWEGLRPEEVQELLAGVGVQWWIAGGWAIDLFAGRQTREHEDTDVLILREDQLIVQEYLSDWDLHKTKQPGLKPWPKGEYLRLGVNHIWCRRTPDSPWMLQLMLMDTDGDRWVFRREPAIGGRVSAMGRETPGGIPYLRPEIQLLYKGKAKTLEKDERDLRTALPLMDREALEWLSEGLSRQFRQGHPWLAAIRDALGHT